MSHIHMVPLLPEARAKRALPGDELPSTQPVNMLSCFADHCTQNHTQDMDTLNLSIASSSMKNWTWKIFFKKKCSEQVRLYEVLSLG